MEQNKELFEQLFGNYYRQLQDFQEKKGDSKDPAVYERVLVLNYLKDKELTRELLRMVEHWVWDRQSLIEYFFSKENIDNCLEASIVKCGNEVGINTFIIQIAEERLQHVRNGLDYNYSQQDKKLKSNETVIPYEKAKAAIKIPKAPFMIKDDYNNTVNILEFDIKSIYNGNNAFGYVGLSIKILYAFEEISENSIAFFCSWKLKRSDGTIVKRQNNDYVSIPIAKKHEKNESEMSISYSPLLDEIKSGYTFSLIIDKLMPSYRISVPSVPFEIKDNSGLGGVKIDHISITSVYESAFFIQLNYQTERKSMEIDWKLERSDGKVVAQGGFLLLNNTRKIPIKYDKLRLDIEKGYSFKVVFTKIHPHVS